MIENETLTEHIILVYAYNIKNEVVFIGDAESGRQGYYCMGCSREMQAKKGNIKKHHFAHDAKDALLKGKCRYSDETYRHKLAKEILQITKTIKVPAVYIPPPEGIEDVVRELRKSELIEAHIVRNEIEFYEDEQGQVKWGRNLNFEHPDNRNKYLLIRPDVTFFDKNDNPILLVELVATHKVDREKLVKIKRLGINAIEVKIPKDSPEEINKVFTITGHTKWLYNYEQEKTDYFSIPEGNRTRILSLDDFQNRISETTLCRQNRIGNLIRGIRKVVESNEYRNAEQAIRQSLQRVKDNTDRDRERLRTIQETVKTEFRDEETRIANEEAELERDLREGKSRLDIAFGKQEDAIRAKFEDEAIRIQNEEREWEQSIRNEEIRIANQESELGQGFRESQSRLDRIREKLEASSREIGVKERRLDRIREKLEASSREIGVKERRLDRIREVLQQQYNEAIQQLERDALTRKQKMQIEKNNI